MPMARDLSPHLPQRENTLANDDGASANGDDGLQYRGMLFTEVSEEGNFSMSDRIGRKYTPTAAGLTHRVIRSYSQGRDVQNSVEAGVNNNSPYKVDSSREKQNTRNKTVSPTKRKDIFQRSAEAADFNPYAWDPFRLEPLKHISSLEKLRSTVKDLRAKHALAIPTHSNIVPQEEQREGYDDDTGRKGDDEYELNWAVGGESVLLEDSEKDQQTCLLEHTEADFKLRLRLVHSALRTVQSPKTEHERSIILENLKELSLSHVDANRSAAADYERRNSSSSFITERKSEMQPMNKSSVTSIYKSHMWTVLRRTGVSHSNIAIAREKLIGKLCTFSDLQVTLQSVWSLLQMKFCAVTSKEFIDTLPCSIATIYAYQCSQCSLQREILEKTWLPLTQTLILKDIISYLSICREPPSTKNTKDADLNTRLSKRSNVYRVHVHMRDPSAMEKDDVPHTIVELRHRLIRAVEKIKIAGQEERPWIAQLLQAQARRLKQRDEKREAGQNRVTLEDAMAYCNSIFDCSTVLMSRQVRQLIDNDLREYCRFFNAFARSSSGETIWLSQNSSLSAGGARVVTKKQLLIAAIAHANGSSGPHSFLPCLDHARAKEPKSVITVKCKLVERHGAARINFHPPLSQIKKKLTDGLREITASVKSLRRYRLRDYIESTSRRAKEIEKIRSKMRTASGDRLPPTNGLPQVHEDIAEVSSSIFMKGIDINLQDPELSSVVEGVETCAAEHWNLVEGIMHTVTRYCHIYKESEKEALEAIVQKAREEEAEANEVLKGPYMPEMLDDAIAAFHKISWGYRAVSRQIVAATRRLRRIKKKFSREFKETTYMPFIAVDLTEVHASIKDRLDELIQNFHQNILELSRNLMRGISDKYEVMARELVKKPESAEQLKALKQYSESCRTELVILRSRVQYEVSSRTSR